MPAKIDSRPVRDFSKLGDAVEVPDLTNFKHALTRSSFSKTSPPTSESPSDWKVFREVFPIVSYDEDSVLSTTSTTWRSLATPRSSVVNFV